MLGAGDWCCSAYGLLEAEWEDGNAGMRQGQNYSLQWCGSSAPLLKMRPYLPQTPSPKSLLKLESLKG